MKSSGAKQRNRFQVNLGGVVELLARNLYRRKDVFVREIVQNAIDATRMRRAFDPGAKIDPIQVRFKQLKDGTLKVSFSDDGIGLDAAEMERFLSIIAETSKRGGTSGITETLGRFGIGLLSGFLVSDTLEVVSLSAREPNALPMVWTGRADGTYRITQASGRKARQPGTTVSLWLRADGEFQASEEAVQAALEHHCSHVEFEIQGLDFGFGGEYSDLQAIIDEQRLTQYLSENLTENREVRIQESWERIFRYEFQRTYIAVVPFELKSAQVKGAFAVLGEHTNLRSRQKHRSWLKGMLLDDERGQLVPEWAFFVQVAANVQDLEPTASRDSLIDSNALHAAREELGQCIRHWILSLESSAPSLLGRLIEFHGKQIKALAVDDDQLFDAVIDQLVFHTDMGEMTIPQMLQRSPRICWAYTLASFRRFGPIATNLGWNAVNGTYGDDSDLLKKARGRFPEMQLEPLIPERLWTGYSTLAERGRGDLHELTERASAILADDEIQTFALPLQPSTMPCLLVSMNGLLDDDPADDPIAQLLSEASGMGPSRATFVLNSNHPLVRGLSSLAGEDLVPWIRLLLEQARLASSHEPGADDWERLSEVLVGIFQRGGGRLGDL